ncbi:MAG: SidA/IucD/PvdA family monooxygenase [Streptosporangiaceae bacterium]|jgi:L-ornithine N5-oxygenase
MPLKARPVQCPRKAVTAVAHQEVEILAVGAGPSNLALAVAVEELAPPEVAANTVIIERHESIAWQRGMLLPWTQSQVSFLKDLVTLRNPLSRFSFVNYLHSMGRLDDFVNMASFLPFRLEISDYLQWVAKSLSLVRIEYSRDCAGIESVRSDDGQTAPNWLARMADGSTIATRNLVIGAGRDAHVPAAFAGLPRERVIHSTEYSRRMADVDPQAPHRVVVVGAAESAAEMLWETYQRFPRAQCTMVIRSIGLDYYQTSKFTNELFFPAYTDRFYAAPEQTREQVLTAMRRTNYAAVTPDMLDTLFRQIYLERLTGEQRLSMVTMVDVEAAEMVGGEVVLTLNDRMRGGRDELHCDLVLLGTGFEPRMPSLIQNLADSCGIGDVRVSRNYRMITPPDITAGCYLQGTNEATHGMADSLISVLAVRAGEIVNDLLAHRDQADPADTALMRA